MEQDRTSFVLSHYSQLASIPLETHEIVVNLIGSTRTSQGLEVHAWLDEREYEKGRRVSDAEFAELHIRRNQFQGDWNYEIHPQNKTSALSEKAAVGRCT